MRFWTTERMKYYECCGWRIAVLALVSLTAALFPSRLFAQGETTSAIVGQVTDTSSAVVPGATVTITNRDTGLERSLKTDDTGRFNFPQLKPGTYLVKAEAQGSSRSKLTR